MAISTYAQLKTACANWLHRVDLTDRIPEFIAEGLERTNHELLARGGLPNQEQVATASTVADQESLAVPSDYAMLRWIRVDEDSTGAVEPLEPVDYDTLLHYYGTNTGRPERFAVIDESFYFRPIPDAVYTVRIGYIKRYTAFSSDSDTNYLLTHGGNVLLHAALISAEGFLIDDARVDKWKSDYAEGLERLWLSARKSRLHRPQEMTLEPFLCGGGGGASILTDF